MRGEYQHNIDAKGRLIFPIKLREELGENFVIFRGLDDCLCVYSREKWERFEQQLATLPSKYRDIKRYYAVNFECEPDAQGRILIPAVLREHAGLKKDVAIIGMIDQVEIWDSARWKEQNDKVDPDEIAAMLDELGV